MTRLELTGDGQDGRYLFRKLPADSHEMIRSQMRAKYGWRDAWISILFDTSNSYGIEVERISK